MIETNIFPRKKKFSTETKEKVKAWIDQASQSNLCWFKREKLCQRSFGFSSSMIWKHNNSMYIWVPGMFWMANNNRIGKLISHEKSSIVCFFVISSWKRKPHPWKITCPSKQKTFSVSVVIIYMRFNTIIGWLLVLYSILTSLFVHFLGLCFAIIMLFWHIFRSGNL